MIRCAMKRILKKPILIAICLIGLIAGASTSLESPAASPSQHLYDEVKRLDAVLSEAFNKHDLNKLKSLFADDLEFYQDNEGLVRYEQTVQGFREHVCTGEQHDKGACRKHPRGLSGQGLRCNRNRRTPVLPRGER